MSFRLLSSWHAHVFVRRRQILTNTVTNTRVLVFFLTTNILSASFPAHVELYIDLWFISIDRIGFARDGSQNPFQSLPLLKRLSGNHFNSILPNIHQDSVLRKLKKRPYIEHNLGWNVRYKKKVLMFWWTLSFRSLSV